MTNNDDDFEIMKAYLEAENMTIFKALERTMFRIDTTTPETIRQRNAYDIESRREIEQKIREEYELLARVLIDRGEDPAFEFFKMLREYKRIN